MFNWFKHKTKAAQSKTITREYNTPMFAGTPSSTLGAATMVSAYDALALILTDRAAFSYQSQDLKFVCRALRRCFRLDLEREPIDFLSTFRDT